MHSLKQLVSLDLGTFKENFQVFQNIIDAEYSCVNYEQKNSIYKEQSIFLPRLISFYSIQYLFSLYFSIYISF